MHYLRAAAELGKAVTSNNAGTYGPPSEGAAGVASRLNVGPILNKALYGDSRDTTWAMLHATTDQDADGPEKSGTHDPVYGEVPFVGFLDVTSVLPGDTFGTSHIFTEAVSDPRVGTEGLLEEIHILILVLLSGNGGSARLKDFFEFALNLSISLISFGVIHGF
jgi:hypothetical protein